MIINAIAKEDRERERERENKFDEDQDDGEKKRNPHCKALLQRRGRFFIIKKHADTLA